MNLTVEPEKNDSVKLKKTTKGYTWEISRAYNFDPVSMTEVIDSIIEIDKRLESAFGKKDEH